MKAHGPQLLRIRSINLEIMLELEYGVHDHCERLGARLVRAVEVRHVEGRRNSNPPLPQMASYKKNNLKNN